MVLSRDHEKGGFEKNVRRQHETLSQVLCHLHYVIQSGMVIYGRTERSQVNRTFADVSHQSPSLHTGNQPANVQLPSSLEEGNAAHKVFFFFFLVSVGAE